MTITITPEIVLQGATTAMLVWLFYKLQHLEQILLSAFREHALSTIKTQHIAINSLERIEQTTSACHRQIDSLRQPVSDIYKLLYTAPAQSAITPDPEQTERERQFNLQMATMAADFGINLDDIARNGVPTE